MDLDGDRINSLAKFYLDCLRLSRPVISLNIRSLVTRHLRVSTYTLLPIYSCSSFSGDGGSSVRAFPTRLVVFGSSLYSSLRRVPLPRRRVLLRLRTASRRSPLWLVTSLRVRVVLSRVGLHLAKDSSSFLLPRRRRATLGARLDTMRRIRHFGYL